MKMNTPSRFLFLSLLAFCFTSLALGDAPRLPQDEVEALKDIAKTVGKKDWNFGTNPCSVQPNWVNNRVSCDCSVPNDNLCHVTSIVLRKQNLQGRLPPELIRLPYLQEIKLTNNYLSGTIPKEWGSMNLVKMKKLLVAESLNSGRSLEVDWWQQKSLRLKLNYTHEKKTYIFERF